MSEHSVLIHFQAVFQENEQKEPKFSLNGLKGRGLIKDSKGGWGTTHSGRTAMNSILASAEENNLKQKYHSQMMGRRGASILWVLEFVSSSKQNITRKKVELFFSDKVCPWADSVPVAWGLSSKSNIIHLFHHLKNLNLLEEIKEGKDSIFVTSRIGEKVQKLYQQKNRVFSSYKGNFDVL